MNTVVLILVVWVGYYASDKRPVVIQQEFKTLEQCQYVYKTLAKPSETSRPISGGCFLK
jgi:hypothetical protein